MLATLTRTTSCTHASSSCETTTSSSLSIFFTRSRRQRRRRTEHHRQLLVWVCSQIRRGALSLSGPLLCWVGFEQRSHKAQGTAHQHDGGEKARDATTASAPPPLTTTPQEALSIRRRVHGADHQVASCFLTSKPGRRAQSERPGERGNTNGRSCPSLFIRQVRLSVRHKPLHPLCYFIGSWRDRRQDQESRAGAVIQARNKGAKSLPLLPVAAQDQISWGAGVAKPSAEAQAQASSTICGTSERSRNILENALQRTTSSESLDEPITALH